MKRSPWEADLGEVQDIVGLSKRERDRLVVLRQVKEGKLTKAAGAEQLGLSAHWIKKLMKRLRADGDKGLAHRRGVRPLRRSCSQRQACPAAMIDAR